MSRSTVFLSVLFGLLIFQSLWNVAAAFCVHENQVKVSQHFGHHADLNVYQSLNQTDTKQVDDVINDYEAPLSLQDHHDHLPSCFHVVMTDNAKQAQEAIVHVHELSQIYYWSNSYQSPHLDALNPPPVLTLL
ncbi:cation efflux protein, CzcI-like [Acinetobacter lactucae]|uniref:cation efflux protein, CzcI-like n=1 Tax=Acinetobacter lactucae TaxID=1785128 RepID=UPI0015807D37|nr:cation efflux protein, CzcI-like [Acinetobacter lactucae]NUF17212.1 cation transporter [Acinetobacter lactucae]NUF39269.1 cation transporter [Acinetobacter lactucae]NUG24252.1 cation transporter [Acinetobacter lactucae]NUG52758.1 cation transporter [Acinetobacter lactucae]